MSLQFDEMDPSLNNVSALNVVFRSKFDWQTKSSLIFTLECLEEQHRIVTENSVSRPILSERELLFEVRFNSSGLETI